MTTQEPNPILEKITIKTIKGIKNKQFDLNLYPNKPSILVAPNGFGKSSFAIAFSSFNSSRLDLNKVNEYQENPKKKSSKKEEPSIEIVHDGNSYIIDKKQNTFSKVFDTFVINSSLIAKTKQIPIKGRFFSTASLAIKEIEIFSSVPSQIPLDYSVDKKRNEFGKNGKILPNMKFLLNDKAFFYNIKDFNDFRDFNKQKTYLIPMKQLKQKINSYSGTTDEIINDIKNNLLNDFDKIECLQKLKNIVQSFYNFPNDVYTYLISIQLVDVFKDKNYGKFVDGCIYEYQKNELKKLIKDFDTTGLNLNIQEETKKNKKRLIFKFPSADRISNGQRDILTFIANLQLAKIKLNKKNNLLIIDEIFDYLDDANLVSFQYYITDIIEQYKKNKKNLYCLLLTHLSPGYFNNFCFASHKLQVRYLKKVGKVKNSCILNIIKKRDEDKNLYNDISKYLLHFNDEEKEVIGYNNKQLYDDIYKEVLEKYLKDKDYDSLKVCLATRIKIEENSYNKLKEKESSALNDFIKEHKTRDKLNFLVNKNIDVPDIYYLLGIIHNENLHWKENHDYETPLITKLTNFVIKHMIEEVFNK